MSQAADPKSPTATWWGPLSAEERTIYERAGYGRAFELGVRPALLVVDVTHKFVGAEPAPILESTRRYPLSCGEAGWRSIAYIAELLTAFRKLELPIFYTVGTDRHADGRAAGPAVALSSDQLDPSLHQVPASIAPIDGDIVIPKLGPSAFFGTPLISDLTRLGIDTVVVVGGTTSGCVRATVVDAFSFGLRTLVVEEAVFDRAELPHVINLLDMHSKYAHVMQMSQLSERLDKWAGARRSV